MGIFRLYGDDFANCPRTGSVGLECVPTSLPRPATRSQTGQNAKGFVPSATVLYVITRSVLNSPREARAIAALRSDF